MLDFVSLPFNEFQKYKIECDKILPPESMKHYTTMEGIIEIHINIENDRKAVSISEHVRAADDLFYRLNLAFKNLKTEFSLVSARMKELSNVIGEIEVFSNKSFQVKFLFINNRPKKSQKHIK